MLIPYSWEKLFFFAIFRKMECIRDNTFMKKNIFLFLLSAFFIFNLTAFPVQAKETAKDRWEAYFKRKMFDPPVGFLLEGLNRIPPVRKGEVAIDLGSGVGHETMVLLKRGYRVIAIDNEPNSFKYMMKQPDIQHFKNQLSTMVTSFEKLQFSELPHADLMVSCFSLPFVSQKDFSRVWKDVVDVIKPGGYFIGNFFDPEFTFFNQRFRPHMTFHTKEQVLSLFKDFFILEFREVDADSLKKGTKEHYYIVVAKKLMSPSGASKSFH